MPMHDWTKVNAGIFHDFHQEWAASIKHALNGGLLPKGYFASIEQAAMRAGSKKYIPDVLALELPSGRSSAGSPGSVLLKRPATSQKYTNALDAYRKKKNVVSIRHVSGNRLVAMIEIVSPGNKSGRKVYRDFVLKSAHLLAQGIHLLLIDPFPPTARDPNGVHSSILEEFDLPAYLLPFNTARTFVSYETDASSEILADVKHPSVGDSLPDMPVFLESNGCVILPLEQAYASAWQYVPTPWQELLVT